MQAEQVLQWLEQNPDEALGARPQRAGCHKDSDPAVLPD